MSDDNHSRDEGTVCFTPCDPDCDAICHEDHVAGHKKAHWPYDCPAADRYGWGGSDFIAAAVKRLRSERDEAREQLAATNALSVADHLATEAAEEENDRLRAELAAANERAEMAEREYREWRGYADRTKESRDDWQRRTETAEAKAACLQAAIDATDLVRQLAARFNSSLRVRAEEAEAARNEERVLMYRIIGAIEHAYALNTYVELEPGETVPTVESLWAEVRELRGIAPDAAADGHSATQTSAQDTEPPEREPGQ